MKTKIKSALHHSHVDNFLLIELRAPRVHRYADVEFPHQIPLRTLRSDEFTYRISRVLAYLPSAVQKNADHSPIRASKAKIASGHAGGLISGMDLSLAAAGSRCTLSLTPTRSPHAHRGTRQPAFPDSTRGRHDLNTACCSSYFTPFFQMDKTVDASLRAMVSRAISGRIPSSTRASK
jgi:hypothetical protein